MAPSSTMELRDAVDQITRIRTQLAATEELRSLTAWPVLVSVAAALAAAVVQACCVPDPLAAPVAYLALWAGAAVGGAGAAALAVVVRVRRTASRHAAATAWQALRALAPAVVAGGCLSVAVVWRAPLHLALLPVVWQLLYAVGLCAAHRLLPGPSYAIAGLFAVAALTNLALGDAALSPWAMLVPFVLGQLLVAGAFGRGGERLEVER